jgi:CubicO group peptidase (beta-lactamase class C family)
MQRGWLRALVLLMTLAAAPAVRADAVDQIVKSELARQFGPAIAIAVVRNGRIVKARGYGLANVEHRSPATASTFFQTGSVGKQFTAALVMLLVRDGKLDLDAPVSRYLDDTPASWARITVRHLLSHSAGLGYSDEQIDLRKDYTEAELLASAYRSPLQGQPGAQHSYGTLGYQVLGALCSRVGGKFYGEQLRERIFAPLQMQSRIVSERAIVPGRAAGYQRFAGVLENQDWVAPSQNTTADGSLYVSALDMARWSIALQQGLVLKPAELQAMWQATRLDSGQTADYGLGWALASRGGHRIVQHGGQWQGFSTHLLHLPDDRLTITVLMNRSNAQPQVLADRIAAHYLPALAVKPPSPPPAELLAATPIFVRGSMNEWGDRDRLLEASPGVFEARVALPTGMQQFKLGDAAWRIVDLGARFDENLMAPARQQTLETRGGNLYFDVRAQGDHIFRLVVRPGRAPALAVLPAPPNPPSRQ